MSNIFGLEVHVHVHVHLYLYMQGLMWVATLPLPVCPCGVHMYKSNNIVLETSKHTCGYLKGSYMYM